MHKRGIAIFFFLLTFISGMQANGVTKYIDELPRTSTVIPSFSTSEFRASLAASPLHHIEGIWLFPSDGTEIAITRLESSGKNRFAELDGYTIILIHSQNRALRPGTVIGRACRTAKDRSYEAKIYTKVAGSSLMMPKKFRLQLDSDGSRIVFDRIKSAFSVNLWRFLPYPWRYSMKRNSQGASSEGCVRIFPEPELPLEPVYL